MTDPGYDIGKPADEGVRSEELYGLAKERVDAVIQAIEAGDAPQVRDLIAPLHPADIAALLERVSTDQRRELVDIMRPDFNPQILTELEEKVRDEVIEELSTVDLAAAIAELDTDDAIYLIEDLEEQQQREILQAIPARDRAILEAVLTYPEDSAGRLMQRELVAVPAFWTVGETIDFLRETEELPDEFYEIFVVDPKHQPIGTVPLNRVLRTKRPVKIGEIMSTDINPVPVTMDQEEVAFLFRQHDLVSAPVVDDSGRLLGVITIDDVVDVIDEEAEEDLMRLGGVTETDLYSAVLDTTKGRFPWLAVNLVTAIVASIVIAMFEGTIQQIVALAVLMPIVASMGGNAGTQTLTVAVRALAMKDLTPTNALRIVWKEVLVGGFNGILFAVLTGLVAWLWFDSPGIGAVIGTAMIINLLVAGLAGTAIPLVLERTGIDPAVASSVFLTTVTDVVGFFAFLGLAAWLLL